MAYARAPSDRTKIYAQMLPEKQTDFSLLTYKMLPCSVRKGSSSILRKERW